MKTLAKSIAAMAATSAIAICALVTAVSASTDTFNSSAQSVTSTDATHIINKYDKTDLIGGTNHKEGYCNPHPIEQTIDIGCYNANGSPVTTNRIEYGLTASLTANYTYKDYYKWCGIALYNEKGAFKTAVSSQINNNQNKQTVSVYNEGPGGILDVAYYTFCIYDNRTDTTDSNILGKTTLDLTRV